MADNFTAGEQDADVIAPPVETMGPRFGINGVTLPQTGRGDHEQLVEPYLMPAYHGRHGSNERVDPAITLTPLGGMVPGPNAIAPAIPSGSVGAATFVPNEDRGFGSGVWDAYPEGCPVPLR